MRDSKETYKVISETFYNIVNGRELLNEIDFPPYGGRFREWEDIMPSGLKKMPPEEFLQRLLTSNEPPPGASPAMLDTYAKEFAQDPITSRRPLGHSLNYGVKGDPSTWDTEQKRLFKSRERTAIAAGIKDRSGGISKLRPGERLKDIEDIVQAIDGPDLNLDISKRMGGRMGGASKSEMDATLARLSKERSRILAQSPNVRKYLEKLPIEKPLTSGSLTTTPKPSSSRGMLSKIGSIAQTVAKNPLVRMGGKALGVLGAVAAPVGVYYDAQIAADMQTKALEREMERAKRQGRDPLPNPELTNPGFKF